MSRDSGTWVALAGLIATAAVGIAGSATTWLQGRDELATRRDRAQANRVFERRTAAYLDVVRALQSDYTRLEKWVYQSEQAPLVLPVPHVTANSRNADQLYSRLVVFGAPGTSGAFGNVFRAEVATFEVRTEISTSDSWMKYRKAKLRTLRSELQAFKTLVAADMSNR